MSELQTTTIDFAPNLDSENSDWFALYVKPRHEKTVATMLRHRGHREFTPLYRSSKGGRGYDLPLFPGYVFCQFDLQNSLSVISVPGVFFVVGNGRTRTPIAPEQILRLKRIAASGLAVSPVDYLEQGQRVSLIGGPLRGLEGIVQSTSSSAHLIVSVTLLQRSIQVKIDPAWVSRLGKESCHATSAWN
jgi:transcription antitermination factor NusG